MPSLAAERIESVKAGLITASSFFVADFLVTLFNNFVLVSWRNEFTLLGISSLQDLLINLAIAIISGFLFGVTYRYLIRGDRNSHLQDGAIFAFGLVRGLALLEATTIKSGQFWSLSVLITESLLCFAIARWSLDWAYQRKLIKPFI